MVSAVALSSAGFSCAVLFCAEAGAAQTFMPNINNSVNRIVPSKNPNSFFMEPSHRWTWKGRSFPVLSRERWRGSDLRGICGASALAREQGGFALHKVRLCRRRKQRPPSPTQNSPSHGSPDQTSREPKKNCREVEEKRRH